MFTPSGSLVKIDPTLGADILKKQEMFRCNDIVTLIAEYLVGPPAPYSEFKKSMRSLLSFTVAMNLDGEKWSGLMSYMKPMIRSPDHEYAPTNLDIIALPLLSELCRLKGRMVSLEEMNIHLPYLASLEEMEIKQFFRLGICYGEQTWFQDYLNNPLPPKPVYRLTVLHQNRSKTYFRHGSKREISTHKLPVWLISK